MMVRICCQRRVFAPGDELLSFCSYDIVGVPLSVPKLRLGYSMTLTRGKDIEVIAVVVVGLVADLALGLVVSVEIGAIVVVGLVVGTALRLV